MAIYKYASLQSLCLSAKFKQRGNAFFRIVGDGVLQLIKVRHERALRTDIISIGLFSMYDSLKPQWFTATGSIARYAIDNCCRQDYRPTVFALPMEMQLSMLQSEVLPWLDTITTQKALLRAINKLDPRWNDELKIGPYLACGEINHAKKVVCEIISQQETPDTEDIRILDMIGRGDKVEIEVYLQSNYTRNLNCAHFCTST